MKPARNERNAATHAMGYMVRITSRTRYSMSCIPNCDQLAPVTEMSYATRPHVAGGSGVQDLTKDMTDVSPMLRRAIHLGSGDHGVDYVHRSSGYFRACS